MIAILYANNEHVETEIKNTAPRTVTPKKIRFLHIHLPKCVRGLHAENHNTLINETGAELVMGRNTWCTDRRLGTVRPSLPSKFMHRFGAAPITVRATVLTIIDQCILQFLWKGAGPRTAGTGRRRREQEEPLHPTPRAMTHKHNCTRVLTAIRTARRGAGGGADTEPRTHRHRGQKEPHTDVLD